MNKKIFRIKLISLFSILGMIAVFVFGFTESYDKVWSFSDGPPASFSGAPGEADCTACHSDFTVNSGKGSVAITGVPTNYDLNTDYQVTVTVTEDNSISLGFQATALTKGGVDGGSFTLPSQSPMEMQLAFGNVNGDQRTYVEHTQFGLAGAGNRSWTFTWTSPATDSGPITFYAAGNGADADSSPSGDFVYTTNVTAQPPAAQPASTRYDFDGDQKADISVFRRSLGEWWYLRSVDGLDGAFAFGSSTDTPVPADFTGDGVADFSFWRPSTGEWFVLRSDNTGFFSFPFGANGDLPAPGDFDGDGTDDAAVFRPSTGTWFVLNSSDGQTQFVPFGASIDQPLVGDYDGDGTDDVAIYKPDVAEFWQLRSTDGQRAFAFGAPSDIALTADFSGDGSDDMVQFRPSVQGSGSFLRSEDSDFFGFPFGADGDIPAAADYDGDGTADATVFRESDTTWYSQQSTNGPTYSRRSVLPVMNLFPVLITRISKI